MPPTPDWRRIGIFLAVAFGIAWALELGIYLTGGLTNGPQLAPGLPLAYVILVFVMAGPALGHVVTRLVTREGWQAVGLRPHFKAGWPYWLIAWLGTAGLILSGAAVFFALFPQYFDVQLQTLRTLLAQNGQPLDPALTENLWVLVLAQTLSALVLAPIFNSLPTLGEEFGWRAYLLPKLMPLGPRRAVLLSGVIWGVWHWPVIAMGYNYGFDYPGAPWLGLLAMTWMCITVGSVFAWTSWRAGSVWPAVIGHAVLNGLAAIGGLLTQGHPSTLLGPLPLGLIGGLPWAIAFAVILLWPGAFKRPQTAPTPPHP